LIRVRTGLAANVLIGGEDTLIDPRFVGRPMVVSRPFIRFHAAVNAAVEWTGRRRAAFEPPAARA
jgi:hypothetical protein